MVLLLRLQIWQVKLESIRYIIILILKKKDDVDLNFYKSYYVFYYLHELFLDLRNQSTQLLLGIIFFHYKKQ